MSKYVNMTVNEFAEYFSKRRGLIYFTYDIINEDGIIDTYDGEPEGWNAINDIFDFDDDNIIIGHMGCGIDAVYHPNIDEFTLEEFLQNYFNEANGDTKTVCVEVDEQERG